MTETAIAKTGHEPTLPRPIIRKRRWPFAVVWLVPIFAMAVAGDYLYLRHEDRGRIITLKFADAAGLRAGESQLMHLGVTLGQVESNELSADHSQAVVKVRLRQNAIDFARNGAVFWIVRPEISVGGITGLSTVLSGPYIDAIPGTGEIENEFTAQAGPPRGIEEGLRLVLKSPTLDRLQTNSPVYYRGVQVGMIEAFRLDPDAASVDIQILIHKRFAPLVKRNSQFWTIAAVDLKGGIFSGVKMELGSLQSILSGGIGFATPEEEQGGQAKTGDDFFLQKEEKKEWVTWSPRIHIEPAESDAQPGTAPLPQAPQAIRSAVGS